MRVFKGFDKLPDIKNAVATIGSFDGVHRGHQVLLSQTIEQAKASGGESVVLTFEPHPRITLGRSEGLRLLTTTEEKRSILEQMGIDNMLIIPFDRDFSRLNYDQFIRQYIVEKLKTETLVVGYDHHMGRGSEGRFSALKTLSASLGFKLLRVEEVVIEGNPNLSSTVVRRHLASGDIEKAVELLGRPYTIEGKSDDKGRVWLADGMKMIPGEGRYKVLINGEENQISIDENGVISCPIEGENVSIILKTNKLCL